MAEAPVHRRPIMAHEFAQALVSAGLIDDPGTVHRIVIDAKSGSLVVMYIERFADDRWLDVALTLDGVQVRTAPVEA